MNILLRKKYTNPDFVSLYFSTSANIQKQGNWEQLRYNWTVNIALYNNIQKIIEK